MKKKNWKIKNRFDKIPASYQEEGKLVQKLSPGDIVVIPGEETSNEWLGPVTDEECNKLEK